MKTVLNESRPQVPFGAKNMGIALISGGVIWLSGKALTALYKQYRAAPCASGMQNASCAAYSAAAVAVVAMMLIGLYGVGKALVFDYHPELEYSMPRKPSSVSTTHIQNATNAFFQSSQNGSSARNADNASQSAAGVSSREGHDTAVQRRLGQTQSERS